MNQSWWEKEPRRLPFELKELEDNGAKMTDVVKDSETGTVQVEFLYPYDGAEYRLRVVYPPTYPNTRFEVYAPEVCFERHQHPFRHNLCVLDRSSEAWSGSLTVFRVLESSFPRIVKINKDLGNAELRALEVPQGEPQTAYLEYEQDSAIIIASEMLVPAEVERGFLTLHVTEFRPHSLVAIVTQIMNEKHELICEADNRLSLYPKLQSFECKWGRDFRTITSRGPSDLFKTIAGQYPRWKKYDKYRFDIAGVLRREEIKHQQFGDAWLFTISRETKGIGKRSRPQTSTQYVRAIRYGRDDAITRVPSHKELRTKNIAVIGTGCLGSASAMEFARSLVSELRLVDFDYVDPVTTVRWAQGFSATAKSKVFALSAAINRDYPFTVTKPFPWKLGAATTVGGPPLSAIEDIVKGCDLIYDAAIDDGVSDFLAEYAREHAIPYVCVSATAGALGGRVVCIRPEREGCWDCFLHARHQGLIPVPPSDENGEIRPVGCDEPTFTGTNYDLTEVSAMGVRTAIAALSASRSEWDVAILSMQQSVPAVPTWQTFSLAKNSKCPNH